jgi:hypothetical protein
MSFRLQAAAMLSLFQNHLPAAHGFGVTNTEFLTYLSTTKSAPPQAGGFEKKKAWQPLSEMTLTFFPRFVLRRPLP